jgi:16S rRNA (cytidine1402-2'-O)-methyltransferase
MNVTLAVALEMGARRHASAWVLHRGLVLGDHRRRLLLLKRSLSGQQRGPPLEEEGGGETLLAAPRSSSSSAQPGHVYFVATPIGNLEDMTLRGINVLRTADVLAAEDTRVAGRLLQLLGIERGSMAMLSHHEHNAVEASKKIIERALSGESVAVISDAGTPGISDPGALLASACAERGLPVIPIPGACAAAAAMSVSGFCSMNNPKWTFYGFMPSRRSAERRRRLAEVSLDPNPSVLYEAPHRLLQTLNELMEAGGDQRLALEQRPVLCARELTKRHEELYRGNLLSAAHHFGGDGSGTLKGEFTLVLGPLTPIAPSEEDQLIAIMQRLSKLREEGVSTSSAAKVVAKELGIRKSVVYPIALELERGDGGD